MDLCLFKYRRSQMRKFLQGRRTFCARANKLNNAQTIAQNLSACYTEIYLGGGRGRERTFPYTGYSSFDVANFHV